MRPLSILLGLLVATSAPALAHPLAFTQTELTLRTDGTFQIDMVCDLDALALGVPQDADDAELVAVIRALSLVERNNRIDRLGQLFKRRVRVRFDGEPAPFQVSFPDHGTPRADKAEIPTVLGLTARLMGSVPAEASNMTFFASRAFSDVHLTVVDETHDLIVQAILERGAESDPFALVGSVDPVSRARLARQYALLGFIHIVPKGLDHILFVFGLFLLRARLRPLVWQITAFTVAHALTLALATFDVVTLLPIVVEPLIAVSIVYVAIENMVTDQLKPWRPAIVFLFGLLHGLGFAGVLDPLGLPQGQRVLALVTFNVGIELGQLTVILGALGTIGWLRNCVWYRTRIVVPASLAIAIIGITWAIQRIIA